MKYLKVSILFFILLCPMAFKIEINNPNLRPFRVYVHSFKDKEGERIYSHILNNLKQMPNFELIGDKEGSDYEVAMSVEGESFNIVLTNSKTGEFFNFRLKPFTTDIINNANLLSDKIYEKITQTKGVFSTKIVFSMNWNGVRQVFLTDFSGKSFKKITDNRTDSIAPKLSHNRRYIVYTRYLSGSGTALRLIDLETLEDKLLFSSKNINLAGGFDKDDREIFFVSFDGKVSKVFELILSDLNKKELYSSRARIVSPVTDFSDDNIAFVSDEYGSPQIFLFNKKERKAKKVSQTPSYVTSPSFTIHGSHYAYIGQVNGKGNIYIASLDGSDFLPLTHNGKSYEDPLWLKNERFILTHTYKDKASQIILIDIPTQQQIKLYNVPAKISYLSAN